MGEEESEAQQNPRLPAKPRPRSTAQVAVSRRFFPPVTSVWGVLGACQESFRHPGRFLSDPRHTMTATSGWLKSCLRYPMFFNHASIRRFDRRHEVYHIRRVRRCKTNPRRICASLRPMLSGASAFFGASLDVQSSAPDDEEPVTRGTAEDPNRGSMVEDPSRSATIPRHPAGQSRGKVGIAETFAMVVVGIA